MEEYVLETKRIVYTSRVRIWDTWSSQQHVLDVDKLHKEFAEDREREEPAAPLEKTVDMHRSRIPAAAALEW